MKNVLLFCFSFLFIFNIYAQNIFPNISLPNFEQKWRTYIDGKNTDYYFVDIAADKQDNIIALGQIRENTTLLHLVTPNAYQPTTLSSTFNNYNTPCITKFNGAGKKIWGTFFGKENFATASAIDSIGNIYICGYYNGLTPPITIIPTTVGCHKFIEVPYNFYNGSQNILLYGGDGYIAKFSPTGNLIWSTLFGGEGVEVLTDIAIDKDNNVYVTGETNSSTSIATVGAFKPNYTPISTGQGNRIGMLVKFDSTGKQIWGTYFGGDNSTQTICNKIQIDSVGNLIVAGNTTSHLGISTPGTHLQDFSNSGTNQNRLFVAKFEPRAGFRIWGTYYGPSEPLSNPLFVRLSALKTVGNSIYLSGNTNVNTGISTSNSYMGQIGGGIDPFLACLNENGLRNWGSYYGSNGIDYSNLNCLELSKDKKALYFTGSTSSVINISTLNNFNNQEIFGNPFLFKIKLNGDKIWGTYLSTYYNLQIPAGNPNPEYSALLSTASGALITSLPHALPCSPIGDTTVFQNVAGGLGPLIASNLLTKYVDTSSSQYTIIQPALPLTFEIYPNPSNGFFTIRTPNNSIYNYQVFASDGKLVKSGICNGSYTALNILNLAKGMYVVKAVDQNTSVVHMRKILNQ
jgi:hypothetical protein